MTLTGVVTKEQIHDEFRRLGLVRVDGLYYRNAEGKLNTIRSPHSITRGECSTWGQTRNPNDDISLLVVIAGDGTTWVASRHSVNHREIVSLLGDLSYRGGPDWMNMDELARQIAGIDSHRLLRRMADPRDREC